MKKKPLPSDDPEIDAYHKWLGIPKDKRPPTAYQLLGISPSEEDAEAITSAAERQQSFVRQFIGGPHNDLASSLLYELEEAKFTLLDTQLRRTTAPIIIRI